MRLALLRVLASRQCARGVVALVGGGLVVLACSSGGGSSSPGADADSGAPDAAPAGPADSADAKDAYVGTDSAEDARPPRDTACDALVSYWPAEDSPADLTGLHPLSWRPDLASQVFVRGKFGAAFGFPPAATSYLENQTVNALATTDTLTVAMWWSATNAQPLFEISSGAGSSLKLSPGYPGAAFTVSILGETDVHSDPITPVVGTYSHIAVALQKTATGSSIRFFLNGEPFGAPANLAVPVPAGLFAMGSVLKLGSPGLGGALDDVMLFRRALTDAEIQSIYQRGIACGTAFAPPDAGTELYHCPAPTPKLLCDNATCAAGVVCCDRGNGNGSYCFSREDCASVLGTVTLECVKGSDCTAGAACCLAGFSEADLRALFCAKVNRAPTTSACRASCAPTELQLCATSADCPAGKTCTGFTATKGTFVGGDYPLGACLP